LRQAGTGYEGGFGTGTSGFFLGRGAARDRQPPAFTGAVCRFQGAWDGGRKGHRLVLGRSFQDQANTTGRWTCGTATIAHGVARRFDGIALSIDRYRFGPVAGAYDDFEPINALTGMSATGSGDIHDQSNDGKDHKNAAENLAKVPKTCRVRMWISPRHSKAVIFGSSQITLFWKACRIGLRTAP
jgi:hypothetical protein